MLTLLMAVFTLLVSVGAGLCVPTVIDVVIRRRQRLPLWTSFSIKCAIVGAACYLIAFAIFVVYAPGKF